jgi:hypothetical protein
VPFTNGRTMSLEQARERAWRIVTGNRSVVAPALKQLVADRFDYWALDGDCCSGACERFAAWVRALPDNDDRFTVLASFGGAIGDRTWLAMTCTYLDEHVGADSLLLTAVNLHHLCHTLGPEDRAFDRLFSALLLDVVACEIHETVCAAPTCSVSTGDVL